jgi:hypothetical protein
LQKSAETRVAVSLVRGWQQTFPRFFKNKKATTNTLAEFYPTSLTLLQSPRRQAVTIPLGHNSRAFFAQNIREKEITLMSTLAKNGFTISAFD